MKTLIRFGASIGVIVLSMAAPRAAFADCGSGSAAAFAKHARPGSASLSDPQGGRWDGPWEDHRPLITGLWQVTLVAADGTVVDVGFDAWHADGTETLNDASPVSHNVCLGVWQQT